MPINQRRPPRNCAISGYRYGRDIHTNARHFEPPVTVRKTVRLVCHCMRSRREAVFLNFQGPGISGEYDQVPVYEAVMHGWLAPTLPPAVDVRASA